MKNDVIPLLAPARLARAALLPLGLSLLSCGSPPPARPVVAASIPPLASLVKEVVGGRYDVVSVLPAGRSPHDYEPTPGEIDRLRGAVLFVSVHPDLDGWMLRAARSVRGDGAPVLSLSDVPEARGRDPHLWLDLDVVREFIPILADRMTAIDPPAAGPYREHARAALDSLDAVDALARTLLAARTHVPFAILHPAFTAFVRRYGLDLVAILETRPEEEALPQSLGQATTALRSAGARVVFAEPQLSRRVAEAAALDVGARVALLDPQGGPGVPGRTTYFDLLRWNVRSLAENLDGPSR
jgi:zinc transport system substrate-binding protein